MGDLLLQLFLPPLLVLCAYLSVRATGQKVNPVTIIAVCFFLPLLAATLRLSALQAKAWHYDTYASIWLITASWLVLPTIVLMAKGKVKREVESVIEYRGYAFLLLYRLSAIFIAGTYLLSNYVQAGTLLPFLLPEVAYAIHADFPPILRFFARCLPAVVGLAYLAYAFKRSKFDLLLLLLALAIPLTRLSRIDFALSLVILLCVYVAMPIYRISGRKLISICTIGVALLVGVVELGNQRTNRFGTYEVKYSRAIQWSPDSSGPADILPVLYGYFPLSFENFDRFVQESRVSKTDGLMSFDWFFSGVIKLNRLSAEYNKASGTRGYVPVSSGATVPTALLPFFSDFGVYGMIFPAAAYMLLWNFFFYLSRRNIAWLMVFGIYSAAFALASFQALMTVSFIFYQLVFVALLGTVSVAYQRALDRKTKVSRRLTSVPT